METAANRSSNTPVNAQTLLRVLAGAAIGLTFGLCISWIGKKLHVPLKSLTWSDLLAGWLGVTYLGIGIITCVISFNKRELARNLSGGESDFAATPEEVHAARIQSMTAILAGIMLLLPVLSMGSVATSAVGTNVIFAVIVVLFIAQSVANIMAWRTADEFIRLVFLKAHAFTSALGVGLLFVWAAAEHLHLAPPASSWDIVIVALTLYLAAGSYLQLQSFKWR